MNMSISGCYWIEPGRNGLLGGPETLGGEIESPDDGKRLASSEGVRPDTDGAVVRLRAPLYEG